MSHGAWVRYGDRITTEQIDFAVAHYQVAILQPWEVSAAAALKGARPDMTVLAYQCLSSSRSFETKPFIASGVSTAEAGCHPEWYAHRLDGSRIEWQRYAGHYQMAVWNAAYQQRWVDNVVARFAHSPFDGVMADNDVFEDYYGLNCPLEGRRTMADVRAGLSELVRCAGEALNAVGKILVPNIAEGRRATGRWDQHSAWGGGYEEVWLAWGPGALDRLGPASAQQQCVQAGGPGLTILHTVTDGDPEHPNAMYGLAAYWVFGGGRGAYSATGHDQYSGTPWSPAWGWELGEPLGEPRRRGSHGFSRSFQEGWAAVNMNSDPRRSLRFPVPRGMGQEKVVLAPQRGVVLRRA